MSIFPLVHDRNAGIKLNADEALLASINGLIKHELCNPDFGASQLAEQLGVSRGHLSRQLLALVSCPPGQYILMMRLELASHLLLEGREPIKNVALRSGFRSYASFWRAFSRTFHCTPLTYLPASPETAPLAQPDWSSPPGAAMKSRLSGLIQQHVLLADLLRYLLNELDSEQVSLDELSQALFFSPSQLLRKVKRYLGITPIRLLYYLRVMHAAESLSNASLKLTTVAYTSGFFDQAHLIRAFKAVFNCSPRQFRKLNRSEDFIPWLKNELM